MDRKATHDLIHIAKELQSSLADTGLVLHYCFVHANIQAKLMRRKLYNLTAMYTVLKKIRKQKSEKS